jgi:hypothetical protein
VYIFKSTMLATISVAPQRAKRTMTTWGFDGLFHSVQLRLGLPVQLQRTADRGALHGLEALVVAR